MHFTSLQGLTFSLAVINCVIAQDECNQLPLRAHIDLPLRHYIPGSNNQTNQTLCDRYAPKNASQLTWITRVINTAFVGNYPPVKGPAYPQDPNGTYQATGILDPHGYYLDPCKKLYPTNLLQYFNGSLRSTNRNGVSDVRVLATFCFVLALVRAVVCGAVQAVPRSYANHAIP